MKKKLFALAFSMGMVFTGRAQLAPSSTSDGVPLSQEHTKLSPDEKGKQEADKAQKELGLNDEQKLKWETAARERASANQTLHQKMQGSTTPQERREMHNQMNVSNQKFDQTVATFLTADQKTKYETMKARHQENKKERMEKKGGNQPMH